MDKVAFWNDLAAQLSIDSIRSTTAAGSGHPTSSMSAAHLTSVLFADHFRYDPANPKSLANDRFVLSKGHASPLLYSLLKALGVINDDDLMSLRRLGSPLQGHPVPIPEMPWVDVATGSLGQGLPMGVGMAMGMKLDGAPGRVWVMMGDSETAEGSVWEAMQAASYHGLDNLIAVLDMNRLGQRGPTMLQWEGNVYAERAAAFGWHVIEVDGHDVQAIDTAYAAAEGAALPTMIVAHTRKGNGVALTENKDGWHGKALDAEQAKQAIEELGGMRSISVSPPSPAEFKVASNGATVQLPVYEKPVATRKAYGETLAALSARDDVVVLDAEVGNSTFTEDFDKVAHDRFFQFFIAEQAMVGAAVGLQVVGKTPFAATFGAFLTRAYDFVRMAAVGRANIALAGLARGRVDRRGRTVADGARRPGDDARRLRLHRPLPGRRQLDREARRRHGRPRRRLLRPHDAREHREALRRGSEAFPIGGSKTLRSSDSDRVTLVGAGVTLVRVAEGCR